MMKETLARNKITEDAKMRDYEIQRDLEVVGGN